MSIDSITRGVQLGHYGQTEGAEVLVITTDPEVARKVGPAVARELYPDRRFGAVLNVEECAAGHLVTVEDKGSK